VSHFGFIVLGIFAFTSVSIQGSALYMLTHGLSTGALFLVAGFLVRRWGTARIGAFGGLQRLVPVLAGTFLVAGLSALSLPGLAPFVSELLVLVGTFAANEPAAVLAALGVVLAALYILLSYQRIFTGPAPEGLAPRRDLSTRERWVIGPLVAALLVLGLYPAPALDLLRDPASEIQTAVGVEDAAPQVPPVQPADADGSEE
jgi:NADH-quinone oxidoreductase subunit M